MARNGSRYTGNGYLGLVEWRGCYGVMICLVDTWMEKPGSSKPQSFRGKVNLSKRDSEWKSVRSEY